MPTGHDPLRQREAQAYGRFRRRLSAASVALSFALVVLGALAGQRIADALETGGPLLLDAALWVVVAGGAFELATLPLAVVAWRKARSVGLSRQLGPSWLGDRAKGWALGFVLGTPLLAGLVWLQGEAPDAWPWLAAAAAAVLGLAMVLAFPVLILPLFLRSRALDDGPLADDLLALARASGVRVGAIRVLEASAKTSAENAFVAGVGPTRRIMLFDTLLADEAGPEPLAETRSVLAHELGHHASGDIWRLQAADALATLIGLVAGAWLLGQLPDALAHGGAGTLAAIPALIGCVALAGALPAIAVRAYSRQRERAADAFAVRVGGDGEAFARALERLCSANLAELWPPRLHVALRMTHPAPGERIAAARKGIGPRARTVAA